MAQECQAVRLRRCSGMESRLRVLAIFCCKGLIVQRTSISLQAAGLASL